MLLSVFRSEIVQEYDFAHKMNLLLDKIVIISFLTCLENETASKMTFTTCVGRRLIDAKNEENISALMLVEQTLG